MKISTKQLFTLFIVFYSFTTFAQDNSDNDTTVSNENLKVWSKYDFVSGEKVIFEDNLEGEQHGEFPSKWNLNSGNAEIAKLGDDNVIAFMKNQTEISPLMKTKEYLPEVFTIEFDIYIYNKGNEAYYLNLKNQKQILIRTTKVALGKIEGEPDKDSRGTGWHHIALSFNQRALKMYFDHTRVLNIPNIEKKPTSLTISALSHGGNKGNPSMIKNIRMAEGGVELYDKLMTDGRIVTRGIYFDVGKATIKPESMGVINEIAGLLKDHPEIKFSIEGHTDNDGDDVFNKTLSENRANSVKEALVSLGIELSRFETVGWGESKPLNSNLTPEEKANNRRVEFVKI
jgi:OmpA-OmpF porin, OOP family